MLIVLPDGIAGQGYLEKVGLNWRLSVVRIPDLATADGTSREPRTALTELGDRIK
jgi:hypothetical protein